VEHGAVRGAAADAPAGGEQLGSRRAVDGPVHPRLRPGERLFAAFTMASTSRVVMSAWITSTIIAHLRSGGPGEELPLAHPVGVLSELFSRNATRVRDSPQRHPGVLRSEATTQTVPIAWSRSSGDWRSPSRRRCGGSTSSSVAVRIPPRRSGRWLVRRVLVGLGAASPRRDRTIAPDISDRSPPAPSGSALPVRRRAGRAAALPRESSKNFTATGCTTMRDDRRGADDQRVRSTCRRAA
jgi:hypothetical protein